MGDCSEVLEKWYREVRDAEDATARLRAIAEEAAMQDQASFVSEMVEAFGAQKMHSVASLVVGPLGYLQSRNDGEEQFYGRLLALVLDSGLLETDEMKKLALGFALCCAGMPYRQAHLVTMDDGEFAERTQRLAAALKDILNMSRRQFAQKTETASAVLELINEHEDERDRAVLMAALLDSVRDGSPSA